MSKFKVGDKVRWKTVEEVRANPFPESIIVSDEVIKLLREEYKDGGIVTKISCFMHRSSLEGYNIKDPKRTFNCTEDWWMPFEPRLYTFLKEL
jgi:hypothetical protein